LHLVVAQSAGAVQRRLASRVERTHSRTRTVGGIRRTLVRSIRFFVLKPAALLGLLLLVVLIGAGIMFAPTMLGSVGLRPGQSEPQATGDYLRGNRDYNADLVWSSLNDDAQNRLRTQGGSQDALQQQMDAARQKGIKLEDVSYIGSKSLPDGTSTVFYLVGIRQQPTANIDYQPYMFTLDPNGKIAKVQ
jgi:hypothetical protein